MPSWMKSRRASSRPSRPNCLSCRPLLRPSQILSHPYRRIQIEECEFDSEDEDAATNAAEKKELNPSRLERGGAVPIRNFELHHESGCAPKRNEADGYGCAECDAGEPSWSDFYTCCDCKGSFEIDADRLEALAVEIEESYCMLGETRRGRKMASGEEDVDPTDLVGTVSDEEAARFLQTVHERLGHPGLHLIKTLHRNGALLGPNISEEQFNTVQLFCPTCMRTRQTKKPHAKRSRRGPPRKLRLLEEVHVDIAGPRRRPSLRYRGDRGNQHGGGNVYTLYFLDRSTERGFVRHVMSKEKGEILDAILDMSDALTIEARSSISFSGKDIRMERLLTDREPGLTSHEGIAEFLAKRVAHEIAAADAVNQTPFLDGFIRRVQDVASSLLDAAGLSEEFWEFAINAAVRLTNMMPTSRHHLNHSADQRWTGQRQNLTRLETFGADVYPLQENHKKDGKDKLSPGAGGNGRFRLMGVSSKPELIERGSLILDTTHKPLPLLRCLLPMRMARSAGASL